MPLDESLSYLGENKGAKRATRVALRCRYASLNLQHPDGYYQLDMAQPAQRAVARQLIIINRKMGQNNIRECKLNGKPVGILKVEDFLADMPEIGKLDFRFQSKIAGDGNQVRAQRGN